MSAKTTMQSNRPATAGGLSGAIAVLIVALADWGLDGLASFLMVPDAVGAAIMGVVVILAGGIGAALGKVAQRKTWSEDAHKAAVAYALQLDPQNWSEALAALGMTREEALKKLGFSAESMP